MPSEYHGIITVHLFTAISLHATLHDEFQPGIKMMNDRILEMAPCSLAIVVYQALFTTFSPNMEACIARSVAVLFIRGPDDRKALAIGARMDANGTKFDNDVMNEIRSQMARKQRVQYVEEVVVNGTGTIALIRSIEDHYDLIIVGISHNPKSPLMLGLSDWEGGSELGAVGDMFALADSNSNSTIEVVQQHNGFFAVHSTIT
ncbi:UNVERIFIED_CONTAM: Cation/H(+) antiporter 20 [Sesamum indicum]